VFTLADHPFDLHRFEFDKQPFAFAFDMVRVANTRLRVWEA
jgi:hypothetical protein